jgi:diguanylate cyclase (GGDEF)-like protein
MDLDLETLLITCALAMVCVTAVFATTAALRHNDEANRAWTSAFAAALLATSLEAVYGTSAMPTVVVAVIDASSVFALGAMWSGARLLNNRSRSYVSVPGALALAVAVVTMVQAPVPNLDLGAAIRFGVTGVFAWLTAAEMLRGDMRRNLNGRILQTVFFLLGAWYIGAAALSAAATGDGRIDRPTLESTSLPFVGVFIVAAICLSALRVERTGNWWSMSADARRRTNLDVLAADAFLDDARDRIERATYAGGHVGLVLAEIDHLDELNSAFGRDSGDRALVHFSTILRARVPADALLGHLGAGRFVIIVMAPIPTVPQTVVDAIRTGLTEAPVSEGMELRVDATFGTSHSAGTSATFESMLKKAAMELERVRA